MTKIYQPYRKSCYIKKLLTIRRENRFTSQPTKESYWKDALSREETLIIKHKRKWCKQTMGLLLDTAAWSCQVKECKIVLEQSLLPGWQTGYRTRQTRFQFRWTKLGKPWNEVETSCHDWSARHEGKTVFLVVVVVYLLTCITAEYVHTDT